MNEYILNLTLSEISKLQAVEFICLVISLIWGIWWLVRGFSDFSVSVKSILKFLMVFHVALLPLFLTSKLLSNPSAKAHMYSEKELGDLSLSLDGDLYHKTVGKIKTIDSITLEKSSASILLGRVDCKKLSYRNCVLMIKKNRLEVISQLENFKSYVSNSTE